MFRKIDDSISVMPQITPDMVGAIRDAGFVAIINNRPDDEEADQPDGAAIRVAAEAVGLAYTAIPVTHAGFSHAQVDAMVTALDAADGPVLAYCRSGTRSTYLWALAQAKSGMTPDTIAERAAGAGYDVGGIRPMIEALARQ
jgi:uncharacterized protein (TIGR01244 family)